MASDTPTTPENASAQAIETTGGAYAAPNVSINAGDFVGGDKTTVGDISHSTGVAIGAGATANVTIIEAPKPRIPLQRPARAEYFQDRKDDLAQLLLDLQPGRVVTICGPGGMGKTALAAEAVWSLADSNQPPIRFPDGVGVGAYRPQLWRGVATHTQRSRATGLVGATCALALGWHGRSR